LGTTTNEPLRFRANNLEHARLTPRGALELGASSTGNVFVGLGAGANTSLTDANILNFPNVFLGRNAGTANTSGWANIFVGNRAGQANTTGNDNIMIGNFAGVSNTSGRNNLFIGPGVGESNTTGNENLFIGYRAGYRNTTGSNSHFVGYGAGWDNTTGTRNHFEGFYAGTYNTTGSNNHFSGFLAGENNLTGSNNHFSGNQAGRNNTTGTLNHFVGLEAGLVNTTGGANFFVGLQAGRANTTGNNNHFMGYSTGVANTTGSNNTFVGYAAGAANQTGSGNVFLGFLAGRNAVNPSNLLFIDNSDTATPLIWGDFAANRVGLNRVAAANTLEVGGEASKLTAGAWAANSDRRIKADIRPVEGGLATLLRVRPVRFRYSPEWLRRNPGIRDRVYYNVIAQEYREIFPDDVKGSGEYLEAGEEEILQVDTYSSQIVAIRAVQELAAKVEALEKENAVLKDKLGEMDGLKTALGEAKKSQAKVQELEAKQAQTEAKLNQVLKLLEAAAPGGGK
jgi:outer membrane murein-binding lipoprotein Lpp